MSAMALKTGRSLNLLEALMRRLRMTYLAAQARQHSPRFPGGVVFLRQPQLAVMLAALAVVQANVAVDADKRVSLGAAQMDGLARLAIAQAEGGGVSHGMAFPISAMSMAQQAAIIFASPS